MATASRKPATPDRPGRTSRVTIPADPGTGTCVGVRPKALDDLIGFQLRRAHTLFALHWQQAFREQPVRLTPVQGGILLVIESQPGLSQAALAEIMDVEGSTLVQTLDRMEEAGLILRVRRADDRRSYSLTMTEAGSNALLAVNAMVAFRETELLADLSVDERDLLLELLRRVVSQAHTVTDARAADATDAPHTDNSLKAPKR